MRTSDRLIGWLRGAAIGALFTLRVDANPAPASRPKVARNGGVYFSKSYATFYADCQQQIAKAVPQIGGALTGQLGVVAEFAVERPKTTKLATPKGDVDNFAKGPLDAATKAGVWGDDGQVAALAVTKRWTDPGEKPGVTLHIARIEA